MNIRNNKFMKYKLKNLYHLFCAVGFDIRKIINFIINIPDFLRCFMSFLEQEKIADKKFPIREILPLLNDRLVNSTVVSNHYFYQDLLVAHKIFINKPKKHVDIGSRVDGFVANVATFRTIEVIDVRKLKISHKNIIVRQHDLMRGVGKTLYDYCDSLSCLHVLEHFGLGRYGDRVRYDGYLLAIENIDKILKKDGKLYLSVPIGPQRTVFNAHRVFALEYIFELLRGNYRLDSFSYIDDDNVLHADVQIDEKRFFDNYGCYYGCGIFEMTKK